MLVGWYLRRGIPWMALLGCLAAALLLAVAVDRWPSTALVLLPGLLACCAAAAAFCFDEDALPVVEVTPRGSVWRRTARLAAALLPLGAWTVLVILRPSELSLARGSWLLIGLATIALTAGIAGLASRRSVAAPGGSLASLVVLAVISPVVLGMFFGWDSLYPIVDFPAGVLTFWAALAAAGVVAVSAALRPGVRA